MTNLIDLQILSKKSIKPSTSHTTKCFSEKEIPNYFLGVIC